jgi:hypothetical protein
MMPDQTLILIIRHANIRIIMKGGCINMYVGALYLQPIVWIQIMYDAQVHLPASDVDYTRQSTLNSVYTFSCVCTLPYHAKLRIIMNGEWIIV